MCLGAWRETTFALSVTCCPTQSDLTLDKFNVVGISILSKVAEHSSTQMSRPIRMSSEWDFVSILNFFSFTGLADTLADVMEPILMSWREAHSSDHFQFCLKLEFKLAPAAIDRGNVMNISHKFLCCHICMFSSFNVSILVSMLPSKQLQKPKGNPGGSGGRAAVTFVVSCGTRQDPVVQNMDPKALSYSVDSEFDSGRTNSAAFVITSANG